MKEDILKIKKELEAIKGDAEKKLNQLARLNVLVKEREKGLSEAADYLDEKIGQSVEKELFLSFFKNPYVIIPQSKDKVLVVVPKFVKGFQVGWMWKETESFYVYQFDQYSAWLGDAPTEILEAINFKKGLDLEVEGNSITFDEDQKQAIKQKLGYHLNEIGDTYARIKRGHIFDVIAETIKNGCLPFKPRVVVKEDLRQGKANFKLRPYQADAEKKFLGSGAIGVFHPTGAGKSFIALWLIDILKGKKVIIVPTKTLIEQWKYYIETYLPHVKDEVKIITYQGYRDSDEQYILAIYDECQRLPADTFSRLAVIKTKYRIGLSATPHREDGRENYIFALTGFPVGLNWQEYMNTIGKSYHPIRVHIVRSLPAKFNKLEKLLEPNKKTIIFCDTIALGKNISNRFKIPYIYGETSNRLAEIESNKVVCLSRVGDLGISVKDLQRIIEVDFLFGSRQQELQRTGRLMHSAKAERHDIIMLESEFRQYGKRLWSLQEKGFTLKIISAN